MPRALKLLAAREFCTSLERPRVGDHKRAAAAPGERTMLKKLLLAIVATAGLAMTGAKAEAGHGCHAGGYGYHGGYGYGVPRAAYYGGGYGGGYGYTRVHSFYGSPAPYYGGFGPYSGFGPARHYPPRSGVSFSIGF
ncbi:MAG: hypothetical protein KF847_10950 [Pirellulales bacterium]|nr:hypothetical protein [Pirellulales bacterium]